MRIIVLATIMAVLLIPTSARASWGDGVTLSHPVQVKQPRKAKRVVVRTRVAHKRAPKQRPASQHVANIEVQLLPHPAGCPSRAFCGCGVALDVFGKNIRELWLARAWLNFPPAEPAPGMIAANRRHVFVIRRMLTPNIALAYDPNSGGHKTRLHPRSIAGYSIRNPHGSRYAAL